MRQLILFVTFVALIACITNEGSAQKLSAVKSNSGSENQDKLIKYLLNKEWQYSFESSKYLSKKVYQDIIASSKKRQKKKILKNESEFKEYLNEMFLGTKLLFEEDSITSFLPDQKVKQSWKYIPTTHEIIFDTNDSIENNRSKIISLNEQEFSFLGKDSVKITMVPAIQKLDSTQFTSIKDLAVFYGNPSSDIVIVNTQGGPVNELFEEEFISVIRNAELENQLYVNVHQVQTQDPKKFIEQEFSFEQAKSFDKTNVKNLHKVIHYFKTQGKQVYVLGISFGAFMTQELLAEYGPDIADAFYIMVGRLDINPKMWNAFSEGKNGMFMYKENNDFKIKIKKQKDILDRNMSKLAAGLGHNRYTSKLKAYKDLSKVTYVFGTTDEQVGSLTEKEVQFLKERKAKVISVDKGTHNSAINKGIKLLKNLNNEQNNSNSSWLRSRSNHEFMQL